MRKITEKVLAVLLILTIVFTTGATFGYAKTDADVPSGEIIYDETDPGYNEGKDHLTTAQFFAFVDKINAMFRNVFGFNIINENKIKIEVNGVMNDIFTEWTIKSGGTLDIIKIANCLPNFTDGSDKVCELLNINVDVLAPMFKEKANEFYAQGKTLQGLFFDFARMYLLQIDHMSLDADQNKKDPTIYNVFIVIYYKNGKSEKIKSDFIYDTNTHELKRKNERGVLGFNIDADDYTIYAIKNTWQRYFGFCITYDILANLTVYDYDTKRIYLTYGGKDWLFQIWKGIYFIANGAEIGIYNRPEQQIKTTVFQCAPDEDMMVMSLELYQGNRRIFYREPQLHWWVIGFSIEEKVYDAKYLTAKGTIEFPNEEFAELFVSSAKKKGLEVSCDGVNVAWTWAQTN
ncbi:MAG TPA: hypothetical protein DCY31_03660 [Ruminococcaceae bacterium]|nr:hypothetical protein [Oscillospiraceae bacterium]